MIFCTLALLSLPQEPVPAPRPLTLVDVMKFRSIQSAKIAADGKLVTAVVRPDRGDPEVRVYRPGREPLRIPMGTAPQIAKGSKHVLATLVPGFLSSDKDRPKNQLGILSCDTGELAKVKDVARAAFSEDGRFVAWRHFALKGAAKTKQSAKLRKNPGTRLVLRDLHSGEDRVFEGVAKFAFSPDSQYLSYVLRPADPAQEAGLCLHPLGGKPAVRRVLPGRIGSLAWSETARLAFCHEAPGKGGQPGPVTLYIEDHGAAGGAQEQLGPKAFAKGYQLHRDARLRWSEDGKELRFGLRARQMEGLLAANKQRQGKAAKAAAQKRLQVRPYDVATIRAERAMDVWHHRDPLINPNQKQEWRRTSTRSYACVYRPGTGKVVQLADAGMESVRFLDAVPFALGSSDRLHRRLRTWDGRYRDYFLVDTKTGKRRRLLSRHGGAVQLSPDGSQLAWYRRGHWWLKPTAGGKTRCLTRKMRQRFRNADHDYPSANPGYGSAGWLSDGSGLLVYDHHDLWLLPVQGAARCLTGGAGRRQGIVLRLVDLDPDSPYWDLGQGQLCHGLDVESKGSSIWSLKEGRLRQLLATEDRIRILAKAEDAGRLLYTREDYDRYPDLQVCDLDFGGSEQLSQLDAQRKPFAWGEASLVSWHSTDGRRLKGAVIKPAGFDPDKRYPVLVYYYRFFSQRVNEWNQMAVNHRPNFPFYASNGYVVFLPDVRFDIGRPGPAATKCLVPGVQKLIDLGIADPQRIALHGHSWSGYQTAFVITQTNLFACAIAGAPVSNMTSAYGGVRWGTGLSRQFQYEKTQSRIGGSLWEYPERYIENSPLFFADRIQTPLLIQFGDEDGAVPWYQGIELYMAMRRLDKPCVFLQYRGEPHHLKQYANKLDYSIRFKEYVDHYCRGTRAPAWIRRGEPYRGR